MGTVNELWGAIGNTGRIMLAPGAPHELAQRVEGKDVTFVETGHANLIVQLDAMGQEMILIPYDQVGEVKYFVKRVIRGPIQNQIMRGGAAYPNPDASPLITDRGD